MIDLAFPYHIVFLVLLVLFQICFLIQLYFLIVIQKKLRNYREPGETDFSSLTISVIICARNELENLKNNLPLFLQQDYPDFEVVVVNDCSNDGSDWFLRDLSAEHSRLRVVTIDDHPRFKHGKKFAVTLGIKAAKNEHLIFSDADCQPASEHWLKHMAAGYRDGAEIVLGYSPYERHPGLLNLLIRYETFLTALNYFSFALSGNPYMGVGRNMGYTKSLFFRGKGFAAHMHIPSGDDDLFVNQNATADNVAVVLHEESVVWSAPKTSWSSFFRQKRRHQGAGHAYKPDHKKMLVALGASGVFFYVFLFALLALQAQWWLLLSVYLVRLLVQYIIFVPSLRRLQYPELAWWLPLIDLIYYLYIMILSFVSLFRKKVEWK